MQRLRAHPARRRERRRTRRTINVVRVTELVRRSQPPARPTGSPTTPTSRYKNRRNRRSTPANPARRHRCRPHTNPRSQLTHRRPAAPSPAKHCHRSSRRARPEQSRWRRWWCCTRLLRPAASYLYEISLPAGSVTVRELTQIVPALDRRARIGIRGVGLIAEPVVGEQPVFPPGSVTVMMVPPVLS